LYTGYGQVHAEHECGVDEIVDGWGKEGLAAAGSDMPRASRMLAMAFRAVKVLRKACDCGGIDR